MEICSFRDVFTPTVVANHLHLLNAKQKMFRPGVVDMNDQLFCFRTHCFLHTPSSPFRVRLGRWMSSDSDISKGFPKCSLSMGSEPHDYNICSNLPTYYSNNRDSLRQR